MWGCSGPEPSKTSVESIASNGEQDALFKGLMAVTNNAISNNIRNDSLAFLVLPVQASCPSCRKKVIKSIVSNINRLPANHFIIISANGGRKTINSYFLEEHSSLPVSQGCLFLDSANLAFANKLYEDKPTIYYTFNGKAIRRAASIPATVKNDLTMFYSGNKKI